MARLGLKGKSFSLFLPAPLQNISAASGAGALKKAMFLFASFSFGLISSFGHRQLYHIKIYI